MALQDLLKEAQGEVSQVIPKIKLGRIKWFAFRSNA